MANHSRPIHKPTVVGYYMSSRIKTLKPDQPIHEAVRFLLKFEISGAPVVDGGGNLIGILTEKDCLRLLTQGGEGADSALGTVADYMTKDVETVPSSMDIYYLAGQFLRNSFRRYPVLDDGKLVGLISRPDILRAVEDRLRASEMG